MSSSVFIESAPKAADSKDYGSSSDSNLVVVYGKNGVNFDDKGLENLIEEKKISSISVIRLTSPTPSMVEQEEEEAKLEEMMRRQGLDSGDSSGQDDNSTLSDGGENRDSSDDDGGPSEQSGHGSDDKQIEESKSKNKMPPRRRGRQPNAIKQKKFIRKRKRERPEVVGLRFEEFYNPDEATAIINEALKIAGLGPDRKSKEDYEFQLRVIKNDHCYTPFTSPSQMKAKLAADKLELEKHSNNRKIVALQTATGKQLFVRKKIMQKTEILARFPGSSTSIKDKSNISLISRVKKDGKDVKSQPVDVRGEDEIGVSSSEEYDDVKPVAGDEESDAPAAEESDESDNDRDSDLDFDVNNPKGRRRKIKIAKIAKRTVGTTKLPQKTRRIHNPDDSTEIAPKQLNSTPTSTINRQKCVLKNVSDTGRIAIRSTPTKIIQSGVCIAAGGSGVQSNTISPTTQSLPLITKRHTENKSLPTQTPVNNSVYKSMAIKTVTETRTLPSQTHKEILINRQIMSSPKAKGFTDLNALMDQRDQEQLSSPVSKLVTPKSSNNATGNIVNPKNTTPLKGFMPLGMETAAKNQLPAQISIQTHQSSSELEAEHDKQLDLINSIVQDELKKSNEILTPTANIENIPELVKMLESTEKVLESTNSAKECESNHDKIKNISKEDLGIIGHKIPVEIKNSSIADIDISNDSLLPTPDDEDDLPDDILQQVVDLIKDDKTLQEAVEVLGTSDCSDPISNTGCITNQNPPPPLAPISQQAINKNILDDIPHSSKSIIEMSISNVPTVNTTPRTTIATNRTLPNQAFKTSPVVRKEPIQIVRGNGRVITLPPIEAPTTRAKRRAQAQPSLDATVRSPSAGPSNACESSLDSSIHSNLSIASVGNISNVSQEKKNQDSSNRRRGSKENITATSTVANQKTKRATANKKANRPQITADASDSGEEDDDDPNKLWCICRQPHNNRFMICCDACEDWFHGTCVNITKAMGLEMEQKGIDWTCPKCVKKQEEKKQPKITDLLIKKPVNTVIPQLSEAHTTSSVTPTDSLPLNPASTITSNLEQDVANILPKESTTEILKPKIQPGSIIQINPKKVFLQTAAPASVGSNKIILTPSHGSTTIRTLTLPKSIKLIKTISPAQSTTQSVPASNASNRIVLNENTACIVCKKMARPNSIYCSDDCIRKHAQNAWSIFNSKSQAEVSNPGSPLNKNTPDDKVKKNPKGLFEDILLMADRKPKIERASVFERKSGRILTGSSAPTFSNLRKWLQENPTFEVVQPGSAQAIDIEKKHKLRVQHSSSPSVGKATSSPPPLKLFPSSSSVQQKSEIRSGSPQTNSPIFQKQTLTSIPKPNKNMPDLLKNSPTSTTNPRPSTPKQLQKYPQHVSIKPDKIQKSNEDTKSPKDKDIPATSKRSTSSDVVNKTTGSDADRLLVRRTLKEQLLIRIKDVGFSSASNVAGESDTNKISDIPKLTTDEIEEFAKATELEMYNYFNRDTGTKYKAKYRSLLFNIKDRKNHTLLAKICGKLIDPKQLVRMSPEELASQELAQWREQEAKHQLEMIKKSELDLLSCAKNYVLKTHKGEEVIEGKSSEYENADIIIPVEDVSALIKGDFTGEATAVKSNVHKPEVDSTSLPQHNISQTLTQSERILDEDKIKTSNTQSKDRDRGRNKEKDKHRDRERECEKRHKSKDRYRDKSRSRKRSRSRSRSRSRERNVKRHKSSHRDEKPEKEKERTKDRSVRDHHGEGNDKKSSVEKKSLSISKQREHVGGKKPTQDSLETYNLVDQILESRKTVEEAANLVSDRNKDTDNARKTSITPSATQTISSSTTTGSSEYSCVIDIPAPSSCIAESDQEPTSTVSIPTPPHDPYARFTSLNSPSFDDTDINSCKVILWTGNINMVDVTSFHLCLQPVLGNYNGLSKLFPKELDVVGRIGPETVWDYISKIKKSPNKEIVMISLLPASETETAAYKLLYEYLDNRKRLGVIQSVSPFIKDFYIFPLGAGKLMPTVLQSDESVDFFDDPYRPDMLIGIIIRVVAKRQNPVGHPSSSVVTDAAGVSHKFVNRTIEVDSHTPPVSPKFKKRRQSIAPKDIDIDAIIKAPIVSKSNKVISHNTSSVSTLKDADEPYSPGGSSDDDMPLLPIKLPGSSNQIQTAEEELKRKMEEINRQIAAQEMEIAGLLTGESTKFGTTASSSKVLANIAIPSNLSQILASIKQPTVPPPPPLIGSLTKTSTTTTTAVGEEYGAVESSDSPYEPKTNTSSGRLAQLSEAELLSMVPDDIVITPKPSVVRSEEPPPPGV